MAKKNWIKGAVNPAHKGFCSPVTKKTCTPRRKAFAMTMKKHHGFHKKEDGGEVNAELMKYGGILRKYEDGGHPYNETGIVPLQTMNALPLNSSIQELDRTISPKIPQDNQYAPLNNIKTKQSNYNNSTFTPSTGNYWSDFALHGAQAGIDLAHAIPDFIGTNKQNAYVSTFENNQKRDALSKFNTGFNQDVYGSNSGMSRKFGGLIKYPDGGITDINQLKSLRQNSSAEVEGGGNGKDGEVLQTPQGLIGAISGNQHGEQGGEPVNVPNGTKVYSEKLKHPELKKSFSKLAKKYSTEKDMEILQDDKSDKIQKETAQFNIQEKNAKLDELFNEQETAKLSGFYGSKIAQKTKLDYSQNTMSNGGLTKYGGDGKGVVDENATGYKYGPNPQTGEKGPDYFNRHKYLYEDRVAHGYKGQPEIDQIQKWDVAYHPNDVVNYMYGVRPNNKALEIWKSYGKDHTPENFDWQKLERKDVLSAYNDGLSDYRAPLISNDVSKLPVGSLQEPLEGSVANTSIGQLSPLKRGSNKGISPLAVPVPIPNIYDKLSINRYQQLPHEINYRPLSNRQEVNDVMNQTAQLSRYLGNTPTAVSQLSSLQGNAANNINKSYANLYNQEQQGRMGVDEFNAKELTNIDAANIGYNQSADKLQLERDYNINTQKKQDRETGLENYYKANQYTNTSDFLGKTLNPSNYYNGTMDFQGMDHLPSATQRNIAKKVRDYQYELVNGKVEKAGSTEITSKKFGGRIKIKLRKK